MVEKNGYGGFSYKLFVLATRGADFCKNYDLTASSSVFWMSVVPRGFDA